MHIKKVIIKKGTVKEFFRNVEQKLKKPLSMTEHTEIYVENVNVFRKMLTEERLRLLICIKERKPESVYAVAKMLKRDRSNVIADLTMLANLGFVELNEERGSRMMTRPVTPYDKIEISIEM